MPFLPFPSQLPELLLSDKDTICKTEDLPPSNLVAHPYQCNKFYNCEVGFQTEREQFVWGHADHVFNPNSDLSDYPPNVKCAKTIRKYDFNFSIVLYLMFACLSIQLCQLECIVHQRLAHCFVACQISYIWIGILASIRRFTFQMFMLPFKSWVIVLTKFSGQTTTV